MQRTANPCTPVRFRPQPPDKKMKVAIVGFGFVGKALFNAFNKSIEVLKIDPKLGTDLNDIEDFSPEIIFIAVPTPMNKDGSQDLSILNDVMRGIRNLNSLVVVKSTITPSNIQELLKISKDFIYNPEFLRELHADDDLINSELVLFGGAKDKAEKVSNFFKDNTLCKQKKHFFTDHTSASLIKYSINSFLSNKVIFFNQLKNIFDSSCSEDTWENFIEILSVDKRIGNSHMNVPGHDGRLGYGGACFPKDTLAFLKYSKDLDAKFTLLEKSINLNNELRTLYNEPTSREQEQNISFNLSENEDAN